MDPILLLLQLLLAAGYIILAVTNENIVNQGPMLKEAWINIGHAATFTS
jgi:hypothetical protein